MDPPPNINKAGNDLINFICSIDPKSKDLCLKVLTSDPLSHQATLQDLTLVSLKVAAANASGILTECKTLIDDPNLDPAFQQGLADCKETLLDAEGQLEDTIAATLANKEHDAQIWLQAALAAIDTCDASIPGDDDILSQQAVIFRQLCNFAITLNKALTPGGGGANKFNSNNPNNLQGGGAPKFNANNPNF
ncbi:hypothetical protein PIB30_067469 [Stylosanthes scabra]|uniref:Pectinesterase inhibitor domain-containing protein n=1 Tax=Stylosanthes scabra TaxID=79078 RepID=A0ABU6SMM7_9FABA|nr:hypothetical protein [Stylosanthes scabra]